MAYRMQRWIQSPALLFRQRAVSTGSSIACCRSLVTATKFLQDKKQIMVPTMGDSITEGTIVEWTVSVGQAVKEGDVVALVETDKVTVDIKAEMDGVITQQYGEVDETVEVGGKLYEIDTEATPDVSAGSAPQEKSTLEAAEQTAPETPAVAAAASEETAATPETEHRSPSIHFLGKQGWANRLMGAEMTSVTAQPSPAAAPASPTATTTLDGTGIHSTYGRLVMTEQEMEALILGGAETAPSLVSPSGPAVFAP